MKKSGMLTLDPELAMLVFDHARAGGDSHGARAPSAMPLVCRRLRAVYQALTRDRAFTLLVPVVYDGAPTLRTMLEWGDYFKRAMRALPSVAWTIRLASTYDPTAQFARLGLERADTRLTTLGQAWHQCLAEIMAQHLRERVVYVEFEVCAPMAINDLTRLTVFGRSLKTKFKRLNAVRDVVVRFEHDDQRPPSAQQLTQVEMLESGCKIYATLLACVPTQRMALHASTPAMREAAVAFRTHLSRTEEARAVPTLAWLAA